MADQARLQTHDSSAGTISREDRNPEWIERWSRAAETIASTGVRGVRSS